MDPLKAKLGIPQRLGCRGEDPSHTSVAHTLALLFLSGSRPLAFPEGLGGRMGRGVSRLLLPISNVPSRD